jgi:predicted nucleotidyltransferase
MPVPDPEVVGRLVSTVVETVHPLRIILFGWAARGELRPDSDIDVLVVVPDGVHRRRTAQAIYRHVRGLGIPVDVVVGTPSDLAEHADDVGLIYGSVLREGREVYAA